MNPVDVFIARLEALPERLVVADFGCGEAKLAQRHARTHVTTAPLTHRLQCEAEGPLLRPHARE